jgi:hypothetical protein
MLASEQPAVFAFAKAGTAPIVIIATAVAQANLYIMFVPQNSTRLNCRHEERLFRIGVPSGRVDFNHRAWVQKRGARESRLWELGNWEGDAATGSKGCLESRKGLGFGRVSIRFVATIRFSNPYAYFQSCGDQSDDRFADGRSARARWNRCDDVWLGEKAQIYAEDATGARNTRIAAVELRASLQSAESSQRGYLVGGNEIYLAPMTAPRRTPSLSARALEIVSLRAAKNCTPRG